MAKATKYEGQRRAVTPPHTTLGHLRRVSGLTIDELITRVAQATGRKRLTRGAISAIENGHRGASQAMLDDIAAGFGLPAGSITTDYLPRLTARHSERVA